MIRSCNYLCASLFLIAHVCVGQMFTINSVVGDGVQGFAGDGGQALNAEIFTLAQVTLDSAGNIYLADTGNCRVRKVTVATGVIATVAGSATCGYSGDNGPALSAQLYFPKGVAVDNAGNIYIADTTNYIVRKVNTSGTITTFAGTPGVAGFSGDGGPAVNAQLTNVAGLALDATGALYIADNANSRVRKVALDGTISTVAGNGVQGFTGNGGPATAAALFFPNSIAFDTAGNMYIAEPPNASIRKVSPSGIITLVAGGNGTNFSGDGGPAINAQLDDPQGVTVDGNGTIFIADEDNARIRMITPAGIITTICGDGHLNFSGDGGPSASAEIDLPEGIVAGPTGAVYFVDSGNNRVRVLTPSGTAQTITFPAISNVALGAAPFPLSASATSGLAVTFASNALSVCTVSGVTVTLIGFGTCSITASQVGNSTYAEALPVIQTFTVIAAVGPVTLSAPANGATGVSVTSMLSWSAATQATSYDVYFGTSATPPFAMNVSGTSYNPGTLITDTTYYWQIVSRNSSGINPSAIWSFTTISGPHVTPILDFNGSPDQDVFIYDPVAGTGYAGLSNGSGGFTYVYNAFTPGFDTIRYGTFTSSGLSGLVAYNSTNALGYTLIGNGDGTFSPVSLFWGPGFTKVAAGDLNGDGLSDFVIYRPSDGTTYAAISNGDGTFHYQYTLASIGFTHMVVADFNGDGKADVFFYRSTDGLAYLGISNGSGGFTFSPVALAPGYTFVESGDINGDGKTDLLLYSSASGAAAVGLSTGSSFTLTGYSYSPGFTTVMVFDFNGDGKADVALYNMNNTLGYLGVSNGTGNFTFSSLFWGSGMSSVDALDLNADGKIDVVIYNTANGASYTGLSSGNASSPFTYQYSYWGNGKVLATTAAQP
jgi:sugar lactone lactonase YvrE